MTKGPVVSEVDEAVAEIVMDSVSENLPEIYIYLTVLQQSMFQVCCSASLYFFEFFWHMVIDVVEFWL